MSDENKQVSCECNRWAVSPDFQKFLLTILASFVGCLVALCLYNAAVGTNVRCSCPMSPAIMYDAPMPPRPEFGPEHRMDDHRVKPHKKHPNGPMEKRAPKPEKDR